MEYGTQMRIIRLESENVKRLKAVRIEPDGKPVVLTGGNGAGKSSVIDSLFMALTGKLGERPVRDGANKARIELDIGEYIIERVIPAGGTPRLVVRDADGKKVASPQTILDSLIGNLALDPLEFARSKAKDQREMLLSVAGISLRKWELSYKEAYDNRTIANRDAKTAEINWQNAGTAPEGTPEEEQSAKDLLAKIEEINDQREEKRKAMDRQEALAVTVDEADLEVTRLREELAKAEANAKKLHEELDNFNIPEAPSVEELNKLKQQLEDVESINANVRIRQNKEERKRAYMAAKKAAEAADEKVQAVAKEKADMLSKADFGVPGLSVDDDGVTYNNMPFSQLSTAEQIRVSVAMAISQNPQLRIIIIREGALIGTEIWTAICEQAREHAFQLWVEKFQEEAGDCGLHIVDGEIVERVETETVTEGGAK